MSIYLLFRVYVTFYKILYICPGIKDVNTKLTGKF